MKNILLTGASGFLGSHLLAALLEHGYKVTILKRTHSDLSRIKVLLSRVVVYDIEVNGVTCAFENNAIDAIIHTACSYGRNGESIEQVVEANLMYGLRVLDEGIKNGCELFINTDTLLPRDLNPYALSKKQLVDWLKLRDKEIQIVNLKLEHMYGPNDGGKFVSWVISQFQKNLQKLPLTQGNQLRDFIYIDDVVSAYITVLGETQLLDKFSELDVGSGHLTSVKEFIVELKSLFESNHCAVDTKLSFGEVPYRSGEMMEVSVNIEPLLSLGWKPKFSITSGITKLMESLK